jgi:hypothetical protein
MAERIAKIIGEIDSGRIYNHNLSQAGLNDDIRRPAKRSGYGNMTKHSAKGANPNVDAHLSRTKSAPGRRPRCAFLWPGQRWFARVIG